MVSQLSDIHIMAKPAGARCNMHCEYCFFLKKKRLYPNSTFFMSDSIMERYIYQSIKATRGPLVTISWQGGEPTLMGLDFFRRVVQIEKKYSQLQKKIENTIQTNGILINEEWCRFFRENDFLVGISLDGPKQMHNAFRKDSKGNQTFDRVVAAVQLFKKFNVKFNVLCTVNSINCLNPTDVYSFFRDELGVCYIQFIPVVELLHSSDNCRGNVSGRSVDAQSYGSFLIKIFDEWVQRDVGTTFIQFFDAVLASFVYGYSSLCVLQPSCGHQAVLEHNGDLYSCDHFVDKEHLLGNIRKTPIDKIINSEKQYQFGLDKYSTLSRKCKKCEFLFTCYGECPKNRIEESVDSKEKENYLCKGLKAFFLHTKDTMIEMAALVKNGRDASEIMKGPIMKNLKKMMTIQE